MPTSLLSALDEVANPAPILKGLIFSRLCRSDAADESYAHRQRSVQLIDTTHPLPAPCG